MLLIKLSKVQETTSLKCLLIVLYRMQVTSREVFDLVQNWISIVLS